MEPPHTDTTSATGDSSRGVCRACPVRCTQVVYASHCVASGCPQLYRVERFERPVMGCVAGVFRVEIDEEAFQALQRTRVGFGGLRVWSTPLPQCHCAVEPAFEHRLAGVCVNPEFRHFAPLSLV